MLTKLAHTPEGHLQVQVGGDYSDVLEHNHRLRGMSQHNETFRHVASIPPILLVKWLDEERNRGHDIQFLSKEMDELVARKLRDPDWAKLRVDGMSHRVGYGPK